VAAGPAGSPWRGRADVLPTGRNLYAIDPRAVPSRAAHAQGVVLAQELVRRHLQDHGDYPRTLVVDLWGSATMRTAGEDFAMALHLLGAAPVWDAGSERVTGVEILPLARLDHPRLDVTLRVSGLLRDAFPMLPVLFGQAVRALCGRDEPPEWNPFAGQAPAPRVYGPGPGRYGARIGAAAERYGAESRRAAGEAWLAASSHALDAAMPADDGDGLRARVAAAQAFVHAQDLPETDLLLSADYATHEAGFAAAQAVAGADGQAALYHLDNRDPARPVARPLGEELARVVRARAAHPGWIAGMMRHGFRGGAELSATLDHLGAFAHLAPGSVPAHLFDLYYQATLGTEAVRAFLARENPAALAAMQARFAALHAAGLWPRGAMPFWRSWAHERLSRGGLVPRCLAPDGGWRWPAAADQAPRRAPAARGRAGAVRSGPAPWQWPDRRVAPRQPATARAQRSGLAGCAARVAGARPGFGRSGGGSAAQCAGRARLARGRRYPAHCRRSCRPQR
jgi:cobaltochelatase CobN